MTTTATGRNPRNIGGSDAACVLGCGYKSAWSLYLRLRGEVADDNSEVLATIAGKLMEPIVKELVFKDSGLRILPTDPLVHPDNPRISGHPDGEIQHDPQLGQQNWLCEIKLVGAIRSGWGETGTLEMPEAYFIQCQHYMALRRACGKPVTHCMLAALFVAPWEIRYFLIPEDREAGAQLLVREAMFLVHAEQGKPPNAADEAELRAMLRPVPGKQVRLDSEGQALLGHLKNVKDQLKTLEKEESKLRYLLIEKIGDATEVLDIDGKLAATFRPNRVFSEDLFQLRYPALAAEYSVQRLDTTRLRKEHKREYETSMQESLDSTRPLLLK